MAINFVIVAWVLLIVEARLQQHEEAKPAVSPRQEVPPVEIRDLLARK